MKTVVIAAIAAAMFLAGGASFARGPAPSSFVPRGPEPHSTLADVHGRKSSRKTSHVKAGAAHQRIRSHSTKPN